MVLWSISICDCEAGAHFLDFYSHPWSRDLSLILKARYTEALLDCQAPHPIVESKAGTDIYKSMEIRIFGVVVRLTFCDRMRSFTISESHKVKALLQQI